MQVTSFLKTCKLDLASCSNCCKPISCALRCVSAMFRISFAEILVQRKRTCSTWATLCVFKACKNCIIYLHTSPAKIPVPRHLLEQQDDEVRATVLVDVGECELELSAERRRSHLGEVRASPRHLMWRPYARRYMFGKSKKLSPPRHTIIVP